MDKAELADIIMNEIERQCDIRDVLLSKGTSAEERLRAVLCESLLAITKQLLKEEEKPMEGARDR